MSEMSTQIVTTWAAAHAGEYIDPVQFAKAVADLEEALHIFRTPASQEVRAAALAARSVPSETLQLLEQHGRLNELTSTRLPPSDAPVSQG